jgi:tRNA 2-thiouridine synthesizing protein E
MITVRVRMKTNHEPLKRAPVTLLLDALRGEGRTQMTDRLGEARFDLPPGSGKVLVSGAERYHGELKGEVQIELWSITQAADESAGAPGGSQGDSVAYPSMQTRTLRVDGEEVQVDSEGYLVFPRDWSEAFARAEADAEGLALGDEHWQVTRFLRAYFAEHGVQASVRHMVKHFRGAWGPERGTSASLHRLFPRGGPQKQGNRLAGLLRTKGEH